MALAHSFTKEELQQQGGLPQSCWISSKPSKNPKYLKGSNIGSGAFGAVVTATCTETSQQVAIKHIFHEKEGSEEVEILEYLSAEQRHVADASVDETTTAPVVAGAAAATSLRHITSLQEVRHVPPPAPCPDHTIQPSHHQGDQQPPSVKQYLVLSLCPGGTLREAQRRAPALYANEECMLKPLARDLLKSVAWMHSLGVAHLDLKPDNLLYPQQADWTPREDSSARDRALQHLVISDFGLATAQSSITSFRGTPGYAAPEMIKSLLARLALKQQGGIQPGQPVPGLGGKAIDSKMCDMFSYGVVIAQLRSQHELFVGDDAREAVDQTLKCDLLLYGMNLNKAEAAEHRAAGYEVSRHPAMRALVSSSPEFKDFVSKLLISDPEQRMTAAKALQHPWLVQE